jgi:uncharacterized membrane protein YtjA (UPF0391 family)
LGNNCPIVRLFISNLTTASLWYNNLNLGSNRIYLSTFKLIKTMIRWTVILLVVAIIAAIFGFGGIAASAAYFAKIVFYIAIVLFLISLITGRSKI